MGCGGVLYFLWLDVPPAEAPASAGMTGGGSAPPWALTRDPLLISPWEGEGWLLAGDGTNVVVGWG